MPRPSPGKNPWPGKVPGRCPEGRREFVKDLRRLKSWHLRTAANSPGEGVSSVAETRKVGKCLVSMKA